MQKTRVLISFYKEQSQSQSPHLIQPRAAVFSEPSGRVETDFYRSQQAGAEGAVPSGGGGTQQEGLPPSGLWTCSANGPPDAQAKTEEEERNPQLLAVLLP